MIKLLFALLVVITGIGFCGFFGPGGGGGGGGLTSPLSATLDFGNNAATNMSSLELDDGTNTVPFTISEARTDVAVIQSGKSASNFTVGFYTADSDGTDSIFHRVYGRADSGPSTFADSHYVQMGWKSDESIYELKSVSQATINLPPPLRVMIDPAFGNDAVDASDLTIQGSDKTNGNADGGDVIIDPGTGFGTGNYGSVIVDGVHIQSGTLGATSTIYVGTFNQTVLTGNNNSIFGNSAGVVATSGARNSLFGDQSGLDLTEGNDNSCYGHLSCKGVTIGDQNTAVGVGALSFSDPNSRINVAIGYNAGSGQDGDRNIWIGKANGSQSTGDDNIVISGAAVAADFSGLPSLSASNVLSFGSATSNLLFSYFGEGAVSATPGDFSLNSTGARGTDISAGSFFDFNGGMGTGTGTGSHVRIRTSPAGSTGASQNALVTQLEVTDDGMVSVEGALATAEQLAALTADDQAVTATQSMIRVTSDDATSTNRTMDLQNGTRTGQVLVLVSDTPTNAWELQDTGNQCLSALFTSSDNSTLSLIWNATTACWHETSRSAN